MKKALIPATLRKQVMAEFRGQCAYCHTLTSISGARPVTDHILPTAAGGPTKIDNLCLACHSCNQFKAAHVQVCDPKTNQLVPLFHPRRQSWTDHFAWSSDGTQIVGLNAVGRATVATLTMNHPLIVAARRRWVAVGWHPPAEDL